MKVALYRHFDAEDRLLYVGISLSAVQRLSQHSATAPWFRDIARVTVTWHADRDAAALAERRAIHLERPLHNVQFKVAAPQPSVHRAWGVFHPRSGRFDGRYFREGDGRDMVDFFRSEYPGECFMLVKRTDAQRAVTGRRPLRTMDAAEWVAA